MNASDVNTSYAHHTVFTWRRALIGTNRRAIAIQDRDIEGEQRWQTIGWAHTVIVVVAHGDEVIRIISARKATPSERTLYEEELTKIQERDLARLAALPDERINASDIPKIKNLAGGVRGMFYRPVTRPVTLLEPAASQPPPQSRRRSSRDLR